MAAAGVFALLDAYGLLKYLQARLTGRQFRKLFFAAVVASAGVVFVAVRCPVDLSRLRGSVEWKVLLSL